VIPEDSKIHQISPDYQRSQAGCTHGVEFLVAIRTVSREEKPLVIQWCMACRQVDLFHLDENISREDLEDFPGDNNLDWREPEMLD
tara:strand:+ start:625 stop:882 length:258 start_codon:yes stop_codon:yes gene_type:complete